MSISGSGKLLTNSISVFAGYTGTNTVSVTGGTLTAASVALPLTNNGGTLAPATVDYTDHGAFIRLSLPATAPGQDALLHLSLPRDAVPGDGFCDIGAAEFTVETA